MLKEEFGGHMAITLYHDTPSSNCDRVKIALAEKNLNWEGVRIRLANKEQKRPEFLELNPYGKIPVLVENGKILFESCKHGKHISPKDFSSLLWLVYYGDMGYQ